MIALPPIGAVEIRGKPTRVVALPGWLAHSRSIPTAVVWSYVQKKRAAAEPERIKVSLLVVLAGKALSIEPSLHCNNQILSNGADSPLGLRSIEPCTAAWRRSIARTWQRA